MRHTTTAKLTAADARQFCRTGIHDCTPAVTLTFNNGAGRLHWCSEHADDAEQYRDSSDQTTAETIDAAHTKALIESGRRIYAARLAAQGPRAANCEGGMWCRCQVISPCYPPRHPHPNGGSCWTPALCAARDALVKLRAIAVERDDADLSALVCRLEDHFPADDDA